MKLKESIEFKTGDTIDWLGTGKMAEAYRSVIDSSVVYLATDVEDPVRPLLASINRNIYDHIPVLDYIADLSTIEYLGDTKSFNLWRTEYNPRAIYGSTAYEQNAILEHYWSVFDRRYFYDVNNPIAYDDYYSISRMFLDYIEQTSLIDWSILVSLNTIYDRALEHKPTFKFEFQCYNLGIDIYTGDLILRDPLYFADMRQYQDIVMGNARFIKS